MMDTSFNLNAGFEPSPELLGSMQFGATTNEAFIWPGSPMLIYLGRGRLMNKQTNQTVALKATNDREFLGELVAHGWLPVM